MEVRIRNSEVISMRVPGALYYHILKRAEARKMSINDYCKHALIKYTEYKESEPNA